MREPLLSLLHLLWDAPPPVLLCLKVLLSKTGLNLKERHHCGLWGKASCESTPPSQYCALCRQQGPAVAFCPVVNLSAVPFLAFDSKLYVAPSDRVSNATFHYCDTGRSRGGKENRSQSERFI